MRFCSHNLQIIILAITAVAATTAVCFLAASFFIKESSFIFKSKINNDNYVQILFVGDLMFDRGIRHYADKNSGNEFIFEKIRNTLINNDLVVANLEGPITNNKSISVGTAPGAKNNYFFTFDPSLTRTLFNHNIRMVSLGNNHILNFGDKGLLSTEKYLSQANIGYFGSPEGQRSAIKDLDGLKIGFVSYNEFYGDVEAERTAALSEVKKIKTDSDIIVIFCHWGVEYSKQATQAQKDLAHKFIDEGADLIIGSHPHVIEPIEEYSGKKIYYSLGNFIFDQYFDEDVRNGLGVVAKINKKTKDIEFSEINFYLDNNGQTILIGGQAIEKAN